MADVYSQNVQLKRSMQEMVDIVNKLRSENESYRQNFENLKSAHVLLQKESMTLAEQLSEANETLRRDTIQHEQLLISLKAQLDSKSREFDDMRERMLPTRELDVIRIKIAEEMDMPHRQHTAALESEIDKFRNMYYQLRRDHELFKSQQEALQGEWRDVSQEASAKYEAEIQSLSIRLAQQQQVIEDKSDVNRHKSLVREVTELQQRLRQALIEIEDLRAEAEKSKGDFAKMERTHLRQISDEQAARRSIMAEKDAISTKCTGLEGLATDLQRQNRALSEHANQLELMKADVRSQVDDAVADKYKRQHLELKRTLEDNESHYKRDKGNTTRDLDEANRQLMEVRQREKEVTVQLAALTKDFTFKIKKAREDDIASIRAAEQAKQTMAEQMAAEDRSNVSKIAKLEMSLQEKTSLLSQTTTSLKAAEAEAKNVADRARALQVTLTDREAEFAANAKMLETLHTSNCDLSRKLNDAEQQEKGMRNTIDKLHNELTVIETNTETAVRRAVSEVSSKYQAALDQDRDKSHKIQSTSKKLRQYKKSYNQLKSNNTQLKISAQHQLEILTNKLERVQLEKDAANQSLSAEIIKLRSQINHKIREQMEFEAKCQIIPETSASLPPSASPLSHSLPLQLHLLDQQDRLTRAELLSLNSRITFRSSFFTFIDKHKDLSTLQQYQRSSMDSIDSPSTTFINNM